MNWKVNTMSFNNDLEHLGKLNENRLKVSGDMDQTRI